MKVEYSPTKNWYISKRNMELVEDRVRPYRLDYFDKLFKFIGENAEGIFRRDKVKITDQSERDLNKSGGSKQKQTTALHQGWKWAFNRACYATC